MWDLIVSVPEHCLSFYFENFIIQNYILLENQIGFRKSYRTADHILTLKAFIDKCFKKSSNLYTFFVDQKKAFDTVRREALFRKLLSRVT